MTMAPVTRPAAQRTSGAGKAVTRISGLDGLRALAVAAVVIYHLGTGAATGGFLGVDLFFVLSGFLITTLLLSEIVRNGAIKFGQFYLRRARRLVPALVLMLAMTAVLVALLARDVADQFVRFVPGALLYASNWWAIQANQSYFDLIGRGNPLAHLWSLAIEEQFYLVWPAVLGLLWLVARRYGWRLRKVVFYAAIVGAVLSTVLMAVSSHVHGYPLDADPTRVYFGTDTHAMSVLVGAALAAIWRPLTMRRDVVASARLTLGVVGVGALAAAVWLFVGVSEYTPWLYRGGFLVAALVFALLVAAASHPASPVGWVLDWSPLRWIGERSYGIYLYHWPIFLVTRPSTDLPWTGAWVQALRIGLVVGVAALSYRYVELPVRQGALGRWWSAFRAQVRLRGIGDVVLSPSRRELVATGAGVALMAVTVVGLNAGIAEGSRAQAAMLKQSAPIDGTMTASATTTHATSHSTNAVASSKAHAAATAASSRVASGPITGHSVSWFGDSVSLWAASAIAHQLLGVRLDAGLNRSPGFIEGRILAAKSRGALRTVVVMHLGDAGPVSPSQLDRTLSKLTDRRRVVLVNSTARFAWVASSNATLKKAAAKYSNVVLADWHSYSHGHANWFKDGLHLSAKGKPIFAKFIGNIATAAK